MKRNQPSFLSPQQQTSYKLKKMNELQTSFSTIQNILNKCKLPNNEKNQLNEEISEIQSSYQSLVKELQIAHEKIVLVQQLADSKDATIAAKDETIAAHLKQIDLMNENNMLFNKIMKAPEDKERKRAVVIARLEEPVVTTPAELFEKDLELINEIIKETNTYAQVTSSYRMGSKNDQNNSRLLKVNFPTSAQAKEFISNANKLKNSKKFKNISIRKSLSFEQREAEKEIYSKLKARVNELKQHEKDDTYCIYGNKICFRSREVNGQRDKPLPVPNEPLNESTKSAPVLSSSNATPLRNIPPSIFQSMC